MKQEVKDMQDNYRSFTVELHDYSNEELAELFQNTNDEMYLKELMVKNSGIIIMLASGYKIPCYDMEDLIEEGYVALWKTANNYDRSRGFTFTSFLKGCVTQAYNRLYNEAVTVKRGKGLLPTSWEELEDIHKEKPTTDDHTGLEVAEFLESLKGTTKTVAELLVQGLSNGDIARALKCTPATVSYHFSRIKQAYTAYEREAV